MSFIGIDLGTSFVKGAVLDLDACRIERVRRFPFPEPIAEFGPQRCEFDAQAIVRMVETLLHELADDSVQGVVMCTQMSCLVLTTPQGELRSNCIGWRDQRALESHPSGQGSYYEVLKTRLTPEQKRDLGNELPPGTPMSFLFWMAEKRQLGEGLVPLSLSDFVISALCGSPPTVEATNAMAYELLDLTRMQWHDEVIAQLGLGKLRWPEIRKHGEIVGRCTIRGRKVPFYTSVGDYQCALAGALLVEEELSLNISTGSQASRLVDHLALGSFQTRPFFDGKFTNTFSHLPAGRALNVLVDLLSELALAQGVTLPDPWSYITSAAESAPPSDLDVRLSFFPGPMGEKGSIQNIRESNLTVGTLFRAAFANMAENYFACAERVWPERSWKNIVFSGGLGRKISLLRTLIQERFQTGYRLCPMEEDSLLGLLVLARAFTSQSGSVLAQMRELRARFESGAHFEEIATKKSS